MGGKSSFELAASIAYALHDLGVERSVASILDLTRRIKAVGEAVFLVNLDAPAVTVQVTVSAYVHENIKAKFLSGGIGAEKFVMSSAIFHAEVDDFLPLCLRKGEDGLAKLAV